MKRLAATLAGLALVLIPSAVAMSSADSAATSAQPGMSPASYQQYLNGAPSTTGHRPGHKCHRKKNGAKEQASGEPDV